MMRILQVAAPARFGGLERVIHSLSAGQQARGHDVRAFSVVAPGDADTPLHDHLRASGVEVDIAVLPAWAYLRERRLVRALCRQFRPDIVHTHGHRPDVMVSGVAKRMGIPTVTTMHGFFHEGGLRNALISSLQLAAFRRFDAVVAVSAALEEDLLAKGVPAEIITAIPNAWFAATPLLSRSEARRALGIPDGAVVAGWVGRITRQKALDVALDALRLMLDLPVELSVVGDGEDRIQLEEHARISGVEGRLRWHGARESAHELMRAFDVFVLSSRWEGTPIVLLEAIAAGIPVVATQVGGVPDVVSTSEAMLVPSGDPVALAEAIRSVLLRPDAAARRAEAALERLRLEFSLDPWLDRYDAVYERLLRRRRSVPD